MSPEHTANRSEEEYEALKKERNFFDKKNSNFEIAKTKIGNIDISRASTVVDLRTEDETVVDPSKRDIKKDILEKKEIVKTIEKFTFSNGDSAYISGDQIGMGAFGEVRHVNEITENGQEENAGIVIKVFDVKNSKIPQSVLRKSAEAEAALLAKLNMAMEEIEKKDPGAARKIALPKLFKYGFFNDNGQEIVADEKNAPLIFILMSNEGDDFEKQINNDRAKIKENEFNEQDIIEGYFEKLGSTVEALKFIHEQGYVHHDIKPANITAGGSLLDFGLSYELTKKEEGESHWDFLERCKRIGVIPGSVYGTPTYIDASLLFTPDKGGDNFDEDARMPKVSSDTLAFTKSMFDIICKIADAHRLPYQFFGKKENDGLPPAFTKEHKQYYDFIFYTLKKEFKKENGEQWLPESFFRSQYIGEPGTQIDDNDPDSIFLGVQLEKVRPSIDRVYNDMKQAFTGLSKQDLDQFRSSMQRVKDIVEKKENFKQFKDNLGGKEGENLISEDTLPFRFVNNK
ncbi:hypothetical protein KKA94_01395 [Patescibacteria group bacterium]|nr:hypothetical protein [Patescibacteria group bacterium]